MLWTCQQIRVLFEIYWRRNFVRHVEVGLQYFKEVELSTVEKQCEFDDVASMRPKSGGGGGARRFGARTELW